MLVSEFRKNVQEKFGFVVADLSDDDLRRILEEVSKEGNPVITASAVIRASEKLGLVIEGKTYLEPGCANKTTEGVFVEDLC